MEREVGTPSKSLREGEDDTGADESREEEYTEPVDNEDHDALREELSDARSQLADLQRQLHSEQTEKEKLLEDTEGLQTRLSETVRQSEQRASEVQEVQAQLRAASIKWEDERDQLRHVNDEMKRKIEDSDRKVKLLQEQMAEGNSRYDLMLNDLKSKGNDIRVPCLFLPLTLLSPFSSISFPTSFPTPLPYLV